MKVLRYRYDNERMHTDPLIHYTHPGGEVIDFIASNGQIFVILRVGNHLKAAPLEGCLLEDEVD